ncbi:MAG: DUF6503 family protein, partial [Bacteroidota bacterium]
AAAIFACSPSTESAYKTELDSYVAPAHHSSSLTSVFDAHGGFETWSKMKMLTYRKGNELTVTNLQNRKIKITDPNKVIGFDGQDVWQMPDSLDASRTRFYHNLFFYFYAMPFVVGDPGAYYENVASKELAGKSYAGIKVSYNQGVGDAPDDNYIIWYDPDTKKMEWLMYTVTYSSQEPSDTYKLIKYSEWRNFEGLLLPTKMQWHQYDGESVGEPQGNALAFSDIALSQDAPADSIFTMPLGATIAPR